MSKEEPSVIFILGFPGSGKGTQCQKIEQYFGFKHLSAGDLLRDELKTGSKHHDLIAKCFKEERIVPIEITLGLITKAMQESEANTFVIDGFPRDMENVAGWNRIMDPQVSLRFVLLFECSQQTCEERILGRGKSGERFEDNRESLEKRFRTYRNSSVPVAEYYKRKGLVRVINSEPSAEQVFERVKDVFKQEGLSP